MKLQTLTALAFISFGRVAIAEGDPDRGENVFRKCISCHATEEGKRKLGPSLFGIVGREAGSVEGFRYSQPMAAANFVWDHETLAGFLADPRGYMNGTKMSFPGIRKPEDLADLLAYLDTL